MKEAGNKMPMVSKIAGERWKALSQDAKAPYEKKYKEAQEKYTEEIKAFTEAGGEKRGIKRKGRGEGKGRGGKKEKADPAAPKKIVGGAYGCFMEKNREAFTKEVGKKEGVNPNIEVTKLCSQKWKALSDAEKKPFEEIYQAKKKAYEEATKVYKAAGGAAASGGATATADAGEEGDDAEDGEEDGEDAGEE